MTGSKSAMERYLDLIGDLFLSVGAQKVLKARDKLLDGVEKETIELDMAHRLPGDHLRFKPMFVVNPEAADPDEIVRPGFYDVLKGEFIDVDEMIRRTAGQSVPTPV